MSPPLPHAETLIFANTRAAVSRLVTGLPNPGFAAVVLSGALFMVLSGRLPKGKRCAMAVPAPARCPTRLRAGPTFRTSISSFMRSAR
ncbi:hypothetical protein [Haematobacter sp.]|uniref:hypothetical protein n=1 Tax=Haematobacter sp. TaxID=2953762 RepID=UPI0015C5A842|nr:hypothetical protein [Haematobacter sp.]